MGSVKIRWRRTEPVFRDALVSFTERRGIFMEIHELQQLLSEMSLQEKIGQMVQLTGVYFD